MITNKLTFLKSFIFTCAIILSFAIGHSVFAQSSTSTPEIAIAEKYGELQGTRGFLGRPTTDIRRTPDGIGYYRHFQGGVIYWHPGSGAHAVDGAILGKWASMGWERGFLGYPTTDEQKTAYGQGRVNHFQGGVIYWYPKTGAHAVDGAILRKWTSLGREQSRLGYPTSDELTIDNGRGRLNSFQHGSIYWLPETGAYVVYDSREDYVSGCTIKCTEYDRAYPENYGRTFFIPAGDFGGSRISLNFNQRSWVPRGSEPALVRFTIHGIDEPIRKHIKVQIKADKHGRNDQNRGPVLEHGTVFYLEYGTDGDRGYYFAERSDIKGQHLPPGAYFQLERVFQ